ncbi:ribonuclease [Alteraurantiacibacter aquimixticola]|uniref:Ribonuclease n=1 Tax=Alteraurantiacibacter aquimixticola TaxID=2489173 RepID=A0A4V4U8X6_9SPHN|nr:ribonuclease [Alteraurantiacibacter aquimixticola]TIX51747.1 ribonuclease [Alteraurantiacibacter aquimixticola]
MAEWLIEDGIGEERALLVENGHAIAARLQWPGELTAGAILEGVLTSRRKGSPRGQARFENGEEALVDRLPRDAAEGSQMRFEIMRGAVGEAKRRKLAHARPTDAPLCPAPTLAERLGGKLVRRFPDDLWEEVLDECLSGTVDFPGGSLHFSPTPAMVLVDVDGQLPPRELALAAVEPLARAIMRWSLGGVIGVDFPTLQAKEDRKPIDSALGVALADWDHERTAMNGFGFVQLVARMEGPSLLHRTHFQRSAAAARLLLRRAEDVGDPGVILLTAHPAVLAALREEWLEELARRTGRQVRTQADPALALAAGFAQAVSA